jgi:pimeloyl-ACP methyl ester carboxylesterase
MRAIGTQEFGPVHRFPRFLLSLWCAALLAGAVPQASNGAPSAPDGGVPPVSSPPPDQRFGDGGVSAFYRLEGRPPLGPGRMIRTEPLEADKLPTEAGQGFRMLYSSKSGVGRQRPIVVSGQVFLPRTPMPDGGWPIVAWEHGTTGIADVCAPSWRGFLKRDRAYLNRWLDEGFAVVATDYQGLGTVGPHPYLLYRPEGYSALDGIRAAVSAYPGALRNQIVLVGQSQGSGAALGAAWLAPAYAPKLHVLGVVATGLVVDFVEQAGAPHKPLPVTYGDAESLSAAFAILEVEGTDQSLHPQTDTRSVMTAKGVTLSRVARTACLGDLSKAADALGVATPELFTAALKRFEIGKWRASHIPGSRIAVPVFAGTGLADTEASLPGQYNAVAAMCDAGTNVTWREYPGLTHNGALNGSLVDSVPFVKALMSGPPTGSNCASIAPPGPPQAPTPGIPFNN